ncbi:copper chaperone PCu(A)C [Azorhizobium sp. AG788]|uniref:copper chaperone PCu(A)C n=1 Tax=Azorhizobium sp. AG788 TaxID=2183897 RepID=UPI003139E945
MFYSKRLPRTTVRARLLGHLRIEELLGVAVFACAVVLASAQALLAHEFKVGTIEIEHPWSRATPQGATVAAGYLGLTNKGDTPDRLVSASSGIAKTVQIHEMAVTNGLMTMRPLADGLVVPAHGTVVLKPGSYHLMFMGLKQPLKQGALVDGSLTFEKAGTVAVQFKVEAVGASAGGHDHAPAAK